MSVELLDIPTVQQVNKDLDLWRETIEGPYEIKKVKYKIQSKKHKTWEWVLEDSLPGYTGTTSRRNFGWLKKITPLL